MSQADDFIRAQSAAASQSMVGGNRASISGMHSSMNRSSFKQPKAKVDPYALDFTQLRKEYVDETTIQIPFVKSSFVHYSKCPRNMKINGKKYKDLVLTMEVVQAPTQLDYHQLEDPKEARRKAAEKKKQDKIAEIKEQKMKAIREARAAKHAEKEALKQQKLHEKEERSAAKQAAKEAKQQRKHERINSEGSEDASATPSDEDADDTEEEDPTESEPESDEPDEESFEIDEEDLDLSDLDLGSEYGTEEESQPDSGYGSEDHYGSETGGEDREYTGNMFGKSPPIKFAAGPFEVLGQENEKLGTNDYCCVSIWSTGGTLMRYTRLKDTTLRVPPLPQDCKFRVGHDAKRMYYIGELNGKKKLVIIWLKDLSHSWVDLGPHADQIMTLEDSSLFRNYLCYRVEERIETKQKTRLFYHMKKNFHVLNIKTGEVVWDLPDCEKVFFAGQLASELKSVEFEYRKIKLRKPDEEESDFEEDASEGSGPETEKTKLHLEEEDSEDLGDVEKDDEGFKKLTKGIMVIKSSEEEVTPQKDEKDEKEEKKEAEADKDAADKDAGDDDKEAKDKKVLMRFFRAYFPQWKKKVSKKRMFWECSIEVKNAGAASSQATTTLLLDDNNDEGGAKKGPVAELKESNEVLMSSDNDCSILALIVKGLRGDQHKVYMFDDNKSEPISVVNRAGNTDLEFNMNSHIRPKSQIFIVQTESNDSVTAKQLEFEDDEKDKEDKIKLPLIPFTRPMRGFAKDCWMQQTKQQKEENEYSIFTICKSSTDEYINSGCNNTKLVETEELKSYKLESESAQLKAQEIDLNYPCLVSNIGLSRIMIQSITNPSQVNSFKIDEQEMDFICFVDYQSLNDIGFVDSREQIQAERVPFSETGDKIAFITRKFHVCEKKEECQRGDILLNVLSIDSYASPMRFELNVTNYEACMMEGMSDDSIQSCIAMQVASSRGLDVTFCAQYNDRIIFDCVTSTVQLPIRFPMPATNKEREELEEHDPDFMMDDSGEEKIWEPMEICKGGTMVRQRMVMDDKGAIFFMVKSANGTVRVMRVDPSAEMGADQFVKTVYQLRTSKVYFLLFFQQQFYLMDDQKKIRLLVPNIETNEWRQKTTLELPEKDVADLVYTDFDEFTISDGVLHSNEKMYFLLDSKSKDNPTYASEEIMIDNHLHISGPRYAKESGMIWYMQQHTQIEEAGDEKEDIFADNFFDQKGHFKGYSIIMQPLGDLSFLDLLPQRGENNNNFVSFVNDQFILMNYSGRYLIFDLKGQFHGKITFNGSSEGFDEKQIKLVNVSDSGKFFVFEGPRFQTKEEKKASKEKKKQKKDQKKQMKKDKKKGGLDSFAANVGLGAIEQAEKAAKKADKTKSGGKKAPLFYIFKLETRNTMAGQMKWNFVPHTTTLFPLIEDYAKRATTQSINYKGQLSQCTIKGHKQENDQREIEVIVKNYKSQDTRPKEEVQERSLFSFGSILPENPESTELYKFTFDSSARAAKEAVLGGKIAAEQKRVNLGAGDKDNLVRLQTRKGQIDRAWIFDNYVVAKCGSELKFMQRENSVLGMHANSAINFDISPGAEVWIENIYSTGIEDLIQLFIIDDANRRLFIITWNLQNNREHSMFQSTYAPEVFPENLIMKGKSYLKQQDFNYFLDNGAIINLDTNLPIQFFDVENEGDTMPTGPLSNQVEGMKRVSTDRSRYLDITKPGRVHHFISLVDLMYWQRFQLLKEKHEIAKGVLSSFSPIARFPAGISVFHYFATNIKVLNAVEDAMNIAKQERSDDVRVTMLPLVFLHSNPQLNKPGKKTTPIHIALDKQSPISFDTMFSLLVHQNKVCVTPQLLDVLETVINSQSQSVLDFFENSFYITDQYAGLRALEWEDKSSEEKITATSSAYLTDEFMQSLVAKKSDDDEQQEEEMDENIFDMLGVSQDQDDEVDAPLKYSNEVEPQTHVADDSNLKQVEAKILDFNWVFIGDNAGRLVKILSETDNDEIFATAQIRIFVDFMWQGYFSAILEQLFIPFIFYFVSFIMYTGYFSHHEENELSINFIMEIFTLVVFGKTFITFFILEMIQIKNRGISYFIDVWNLVDIGSLCLNCVYVFGEITNSISHEQLQVFGSIAIFMMWFKLFYWMRLFKPFSAFIRMITEIIKDIQVFLVMLIIALSAFANIIFLLNINRQEQGGEPLYESLIGIAPLDAMIHAYLMGLGDFNKDTYSSENSKVVWIMFILATIIVALIFMNLLIAIMGESFSRITAIMQQSTLKELCSIMEDHIWLQKIDELFESKRYILWLTPDTSTGGGSLVERAIQQLKDQFANRSDAQEQKILRAINLLSEDVANLKSTIEEATKQDEESD